MLRLLPAPTYLASHRGGKGLQITSKLYWMREDDIDSLPFDRSQTTATITAARDEFIVYHEDTYHTSSSTFDILMYPVFWFLLFGRVMFGYVSSLMEILATSKFVTVPSTKADHITISPPGLDINETGELFKKFIGLALVEIIVPVFELLTRKSRVQVETSKVRVSPTD